MGCRIVNGKQAIRLYHRGRGFTLIELLITMTIIALLLSIVTPRYFNSLGKAEEAVLRQDLSLMREALDQYYADQGRYPASLQDLVSQKYIRNIPQDPITQSKTSWIVVAPQEGVDGEVFDIRSGAAGKANDGSYYRDW